MKLGNPSFVTLVMTGEEFAKYCEEHVFAQTGIPVKFSVYVDNDDDEGDFCLEVTNGDELGDDKLDELAEAYYVDDNWELPDQLVEEMLNRKDEFTGLHAKQDDDTTKIFVEVPYDWYRANMEQETA